MPFIFFKEVIRIIKLKEDFWETETYFKEDAEGKGFAIVDKKEGDLYYFFEDDETQIFVTNVDDLVFRDQVLDSIKAGEDRYIRIDEKGVTVDERIEIMKEYNLMPKDGFPSDEELKEEKEKGKLK